MMNVECGRSARRQRTTLSRAGARYFQLNQSVKVSAFLQPCQEILRDNRAAQALVKKIT
jgi:hypothetical protein